MERHTIAFVGQQFLQQISFGLLIINY